MALLPRDSTVEQCPASVLGCPAELCMLNGYRLTASGRCVPGKVGHTEAGIDKIHNNARAGHGE